MPTKEIDIYPSAALYDANSGCVEIIAKSRDGRQTYRVHVHPVIFGRNNKEFNALKAVKKAIAEADKQ